MRPLQSFTANRDLGINRSNTCLICVDPQKPFDQSRPTPLDSARLAHDAGNLLSALILYAELLASPGVLPEQYRSYADEMKTLAHRSNALIERLAGYRRISILGPQKVVLSDLLAEYKGVLTRATGRPIEVSIGPFADQTIAVSRESVERVLLNLTKNAANATLPSGTIRIVVEGTRMNRITDKSHVLLTVTDDGKGMSREQLRMIFEPVPLQNRAGRGHGLQIVRELVEESGGHLNIRSYPGRGTQVRVKWFTRRNDAA